MHFNKATASATDLMAWDLCQILDDDAPIGWTRYRPAAEFIIRQTGNAQQDAKRWREVSRRVYIDAAQRILRISGVVLLERTGPTVEAQFTAAIDAAMNEGRARTCEDGCNGCDACTDFEG